MSLSTKLEQFVFSDPLHCFIRTKSGYETNRGDNPFYNSLQGVRPEAKLYDYGVNGKMTKTHQGK